MSMMWGADWGWGALMMISFWVLLAVLVWALVRIASRHERHESPRGPLDLLAERYARGEIDEEEYERRRRTLRENR
jgi:putative membrane protein